MRSASSSVRPQRRAVSRRSQLITASGGHAARCESPICAPYSRTMRACRALLIRMVESRSNAAAGRSGRMAASAPRRMRACSVRTARDPKGCVGMRRREYQSRRPVGKAVLHRGSPVPTFVEPGRGPRAVGHGLAWPAARKEPGTSCAQGENRMIGKLGRWAVAVALCVGCSKSPPVDNSKRIGVDGGPPPPTDAGSPPDDGGSPPPPPPPPDGGTPDAGPKFGGPGPWPTTNVTYGSADGIQEMPVVGISTDETQNIWVATNAALYLMQPGQTSFRRFDAGAGLHLPGNVAASCDDSAGVLKPCPNGAADSPGISEIVGGGPNEVFVGYYGHHDWNDPNDGTEQDPWRHSGKLDRVRLQANGSLEVVRFDMVSDNTVQFWHNRTVERMIYDHFIHPHELYVGTDHGVDKISPDLYHPSVGWFLKPENQPSWMSDHLHPQTCYHMQC